MAFGRIVSGIALLALAATLSACGVSTTIDPVAAAASKTENAGGVA